VTAPGGSAATGAAGEISNSDEFYQAAWSLTYGESQGQGFADAARSRTAGTHQGPSPWNLIPLK